MFEPFRLGLRGHRHMVGLVRGSFGGRTQLGLGLAYREGMNPRDHILDQWGIEAGSPRKNMRATVDTPLPTRHRVALAAQLPPSLQATLRSGFENQPSARRDIVQGVKGRMHLSPYHEPLRNGLPPIGQRPGALPPVSKGKARGGR